MADTCCASHASSSSGGDDGDDGFVAFGGASGAPASRCPLRWGCCGVGRTPTPIVRSTSGPLGRRGLVAAAARAGAVPADHHAFGTACARGTAADRQQHSGSGPICARRGISAVAGHRDLSAARVVPPTGVTPRCTPPRAKPASPHAPPRSGAGATLWQLPASSTMAQINNDDGDDVPTDKYAVAPQQAGGGGCGGVATCRACQRVR